MYNEDEDVVTKSSPKDIIARLKRKQSQDQKANATFRFNKEIMDHFRQKCEKEGLSMTAVLEELMAGFVE